MKKSVKQLLKVILLVSGIQKFGAILARHGYKGMKLTFPYETNHKLQTEALILQAYQSGPLPPSGSLQGISSSKVFLKLMSIRVGCLQKHVRNADTLITFNTCQKCLIHSQIATSFFLQLSCLFCFPAKRKITEKSHIYRTGHCSIWF